MCCVESIPPCAVNQKILPGPNRVNFSRVTHLNWLVQIELKGPGGLWSSVLLLITVVREDATMKLKLKKQ